MITAAPPCVCNRSTTLAAQQVSVTCPPPTDGPRTHRRSLLATLLRMGSYLSVCRLKTLKQKLPWRSCQSSLVKGRLFARRSFCTCARARQRRVSASSRSFLQGRLFHLLVRRTMAGGDVQVCRAGLPRGLFPLGLQDLLFPLQDPECVGPLQSLCHPCIGFHHAAANRTTCQSRAYICRALLAQRCASTS